jgi:spore coat polysaccharide biosynthesis protein SpsF (cytidylyltransferase family)
LHTSTEFIDWDLITTKGKGIPGLDIEVIRRSSMSKIVGKLNEYDQEHVTSFFYRNSADFRIEFIGKQVISSMQESFLLDTMDDFIKINNFFNKNGVDFTFKV